MLIYELYIDKFAKNIKGLISNLNYIKNLGMDAIWILPHYPSPLVDDGYDVQDFKNVRTDLGTTEEFKELVKTSHKVGLKIIIDLPINHTSTEHAWFKEARSSVDNPKRNYYIWGKSGADMLTAVNAFPNAKLTNWVYNPFTKDYYFATFYPLQPDLNWDNPQVLNEFLSIIDFWFDMGIDGVRLDAVTHIIKRKHSISVALPETHNIVKTIRTHIDSRYDDKMIIGEADLPTRHAADYFGNGTDECTSLFDFEGSLYYWLYYFEKSEVNLNQIKRNTEGTCPKNDWIYFLGTHDTFPLSTLPLDQHQKLKKYLDPLEDYKEKHDERIAQRVGNILNSDTEKIIKLYTDFVSLKGHKIIYYGDELGTQNYKTNEFLIDNRHEIRGHFDWQEQQKQAQSPTSLLNRLTALFITQSI